MAGELADLLPPDVQPRDTLYVADKDLNVIFTNEEWTGFAARNKGRRVLQVGRNLNLLENMSGREKERWRHIYRLLLEGRIPHHEENFICSSPVERRIYRLRITPKKDQNGQVSHLVHHTRSIDDERSVLDRLGQQLGALEDPERLTQEYQDRIIKRRIRIPRFQVARHFQPLEQIGGDLLWHCEYVEGVADLVHADVVGHGVEAGRFAAQIAIVLDEVAAHDQAVGQMVSGLNRALLGLASGDQVVFATGLLFRFGRQEQRLVCSSFGHHGPIFSRTGEVPVESGLPVGLTDEAESWPETWIDLEEHGKRFLVFSDGITEQFNIEGEMYGSTRLIEAFRRYLELPLAEMLNKIVEQLERFRGSAMVKDDQTLLALECIDGD
jgi:serine phosphatase RsbU (regulator of sigma subunit)